MHCLSHGDRGGQPVTVTGIVACLSGTQAADSSYIMMADALSAASGGGGSPGSHRDSYGPLTRTVTVDAQLELSRSHVQGS